MSEDLGILPVAPPVRAAFRDSVARVAPAGCRIEEDAPPLAGLPDAIKALRGLSYLATWQHLWPHERHRFTPEVAGDIAFGATLGADRIADAFSRRALAYRQMIGFFERHDLLLCPAVQVAPFAVGQRWPSAIDGRPCGSYVDWIMITYVWSVLGCPAASVPLGIGEDGLPVSVQVVGPPHADATVISFAAWLEAECAAARR